MKLFRAKTVQQKYDKLIKLIQSIDSHFTITETEEYLIVLHLPNYKGNIEMTFEIHQNLNSPFPDPLEEYVFITFTAIVEDKIVKVIKKYHQSTDQHTMFNEVSSEGLRRCREIIKGAS